MELTREQHEANLVKEMLKTEGWKILVRKLADRQEALRLGWLNESTPEKAEVIRRKALGLVEFLRIVATTLNRGKGQPANPPSAQAEQGETNGNEPK
ncbi:MAG: hypothetical protein AB7V39_00560 [Nitrospiraceae bacterium]